jgi:uncharacterized protein DUF1348
MTTRPPLPPFTRETAIQKVRLAEDGWNTRDAEKVALVGLWVSLEKSPTRAAGIARRSCGNALNQIAALPRSLDGEFSSHRLEICPQVTPNSSGSRVNE